MKCKKLLAIITAVFMILPMFCFTTAFAAKTVDWVITVPTDVERNIGDTITKDECITNDSDGSWYFNETRKFTSKGNKSVSVVYKPDDPDYNNVVRSMNVKVNLLAGGGNVDFTAPVFEEIGYGYSTPDREYFTIINYGDRDVTIKSITCDNTVFDISYSRSKIAAGETNTSCSIRPKTRLEVGDYTGNVELTIECEGNEYTFYDSVFVEIVAAEMDVTATPDVIYDSDLSDMGFVVDFYAGPAAIASVTLADAPGKIERGTVITANGKAFFFAGAPLGTYDFIVSPKDELRYVDTTVSVELVYTVDSATVAKTTGQLTNNINSIKSGGTLEVDGVTLITAKQVSTAASKNLTLNVKVDDTYSWVVEMNKLGVKSANLDLGIKNYAASSMDINKYVIGTSDKSIGFITAAAGLNNAATLTVNTGVKSTSSQNYYANLYEYDSAGRMLFVEAVKVGTNGLADLPIKEDGKYVLVVAKETKIIGDIDNSCGINSKDATAAIKMVAQGGVTASNAPKVDYNGDGKTNIADVTAMLKDIASGKVR